MKIKTVPRTSKTRLHWIFHTNFGRGFNSLSPIYYIEGKMAAHTKLRYTIENCSITVSVVVYQEDVNRKLIALLFKFRASHARGRDPFTPRNRHNQSI